MADDLGYGELGAYGQELIETPNIDALAKGGMLFTDFYSGSPVCAPARCVLMTGMHTGHAIIRGNDEWRERGEVWDFAKAVEDPNLEGQRPLAAGTQTMGTVLQQAGYRTAIVGKWGLGAPLTEGIPNKQGFDFFFGYNCQRQAHTYFPKHLWRNEEKVLLENKLVVPNTKLAEGVDTLAPESYQDFWLSDFAGDRLLEEALGFLDRQTEDPFFLYYASPIPHVPLQAPSKWVNYYLDKFGDEAPYLGQRGYFPNRYPHATYAAMISYLDEQVGALIKKLEEQGKLDNTIILFTSDNGPSFNGGTDSPFFDSAGPFKSERGWGKGSVNEGGIRVPLIAKWEGKIKAGSISDHPSVFYDLLPTFAELAGTELQEAVDGLSIAAELRGEPLVEKHPYLYWEFPAYGGQQAIRLGNWKAIRKNIKSEQNLEIALFDLESDPQELTNVADQHEELVEQIKQYFAQEHTEPSIQRFRMAALGDSKD